MFSRVPGFIRDSLQNLVSAMGTDKDKARSTRFGGDMLSRQEIELAYRFNGTARKIVDIPAMDMTRAGRNWKASEADTKALEAEERRLGLWPKLQQALIWDRGLGGGALIIGDGADDPSKPLDVDSIAKGGIKYIQAVNRYILVGGPIERDPESDFFGRPGSYELQSEDAPVTLHASRVIPFVSFPVLDPSLAVGDGWGDSILQSIQTEVKNAGSAVQSLATLVFEAKVDVLRIPDLMANIGNAEYRDRLLTRMELANVAKSTVNSLLLDKDEEWERKEVKFADLPEVVTTLLTVVCGVADIPMTRLFGVQSKGMNNDGTGDLKNYYDGISGRQTMFLRPELERLDHILQRSALGRVDDGITWTFTPLWTPSEKEKAETSKAKAETTKIYVDTALFPVDALAVSVAAQLEDDGVYPSFQAAIEDAEEEADWEKDPAELNPLLALPAPTPGQVPPGAPKPPAAPGKPVAAPRPATPAAGRRQARDAKTIRTLYVKRTLLNADELRAWARENGIQTTLLPEDLHVTVAFSRRPLDWSDIQPDPNPLTVENEGYRYLDFLGARDAERRALVLAFCSDALRTRWQAIIDAGASWDWPHYQPHVTLTYQSGAHVDPWLINPFFGKLEFGPEVFAEVDEDWSADITEVPTEPQAT